MAKIEIIADTETQTMEVVVDGNKIECNYIYAYSDPFGIEICSYKEVNDMMVSTRMVSMGQIKDDEKTVASEYDGLFHVTTKKSLNQIVRDYVKAKKCQNC